MRRDEITKEVHINKEEKIFRQWGNAQAQYSLLHAHQMAKAPLYIWKEPYRNIWIVDQEGCHSFIHYIVTDCRMVPSVNSLREKRRCKTLGLEGKERLTNLHETQTDVVSAGKRGCIRSLPAAWKQLRQEAVNTTENSGLGWGQSPLVSHHRSFFCPPPLSTAPRACPASPPSTPGHSPREWVWLGLVIVPLLYPEHLLYNTFNKTWCDWVWVGRTIEKWP